MLDKAQRASSAPLQHATPNPSPQDDKRSLWIALLVAGTFFMENLDGTVIATALPDMAKTFGRAPVDLNVGMSAYLLTLAVFIPISGWVADRFGPRSVFATAVAVFTLASIACGLSDSLPVFIAMRILQGVGGAMMVPVGRLVVLKNTPKPKLMNAIATITWPGLVAPVLGPPLGGAITTYASWRWIFYLNIPLGLVAFALALWLVPKRRSDNTRQFDWFGFIASGLGFLSLMYGAELLGQAGALSWGPVLGFLVVGVILGGFAVRHFRRTAEPMIDLHALSYPSFAVTIWGGSLFRISISVIPFLLPLMFQLGFGMDAFHSGLLVLAVFAGNLLMKPGVSAVLRYVGFKNVLVYNGLLNAVTLLLCGFLTPATPIALIVFLLFVGGMSRSLQFTALNTIAFSDVPQPRMNGASTLFSTAMQLSSGLGIAIGAVALRAGGALTSATGWGHEASDAGSAVGALAGTGTTAAPGMASHVASTAASHVTSNIESSSHGLGHLPMIDFHLAFVFVSVMAFLAILDCLKLPHDVGSQLASRRA